MSDLDNVVLTVNRMSEAGPAGRFWPVVFVGGCNLRCPYCLNTSIVDPSQSMKYISLEEVEWMLDVWDEEGVMISGGEPLNHPAIFDLVRVLSKGRKVGFSTNGTKTHELQDLLSTGLISYVAMDFKFSPRCDDFEEKVKIIGGDPKFGCGLLGSISRIGNWRVCCPGTDSEIRVTLYPPLVGEFDVSDAAFEAYLSHSRLVLQQYRPNRMFDGTANSVVPYPEEEVNRLKTVAEESGRGKVMVEVRWP